MPPGKIEFKKVQSAFFTALILLFGLTSLYIFRPFLYPIFWAAILAISFYPAYKMIDRYIKNSSVSSGITVLLVIALVLVPLLSIATLLVQQSADLYQKVTTTNSLQIIDVEEIQTRIDEIPLIGQYADDIRETLPQAAQNTARTVSNFLFQNFKALTQYSIRFFFQFFIMLYTLYYFLKDGKRMLKRLTHLSPLGDEYEEVLYKRFTSTARATLKGTVIIGIIQGTIGGILFAFTGVPGAFLWGVVMTLLSIVPGLGAALVWLPAGIIMLALGNIGQGITILAVGAVIISLIDNLVRPPLVGHDTQMHPILILFSTLGGIAMFGLSGFIIGPVVISLFLAVMSMYDQYYKRELNKN